MNLHQKFRARTCPAILLFCGLLFSTMLSALDSAQKIPLQTALSTTAATPTTIDSGIIDILCLGAGFIWVGMLATVAAMVLQEIREPLDSAA
jgi:hypothetical protein